MDNQYNTPQKIKRINERENQNINEELEEQQLGTDLKRMHSELRQQIEDKQVVMQQQKDGASRSNQAWRFFQIINIFISLLFGLGCLTLYPDIHLLSKRVFYLVIFYMAISIICFFFSLILMILFWLTGKICSRKTAIQPPPLPQSHQNTNRSSANNRYDMYSSQLNKGDNSATNLEEANNYINYNSHNNNNNNNNNINQLNQSLDSEHSVTRFRQINYNQEQVPWCNIGWFPLIYYSTLYIAYFFYLIFSSQLILQTWKTIPFLISLFLGYIWIIGIMHVLTAIALLFSRKFISRHIEEMEEAEVYRIDEKEIQRRKQEILAARNQDILNNIKY